MTFVSSLFLESEDEADSDSGLSLDFSHSHSSPSESEASSYSSSSCSSSSFESAVGTPFSEDGGRYAEEGFGTSDIEVEVTIKQEDEDVEELGAVGGQFPPDVNGLDSPNFGDHKLVDVFPWREQISHNHTYNEPRSSVSTSSMCKTITKHTKSSRRHDYQPYQRSSSRHMSTAKTWSRDDRRSRALTIPFSNELIVNLPVEEFNELLANYPLSDEQLTLVRDIRRRGKNKIAAQNCRSRKLCVLLELEEEVSGLRHRRLRLLREKQEALRNLQEAKQRLGMLYQEVLSRLRDEQGGRPDSSQHRLDVEPDGSVTAASREQGAGLPNGGGRASKKHRDKKK